MDRDTRSYMNRQLQVAKTLLILDGMWPLKLKGFLQLIYDGYFYIGYGFLMFILFCQCTEATYFLILNEWFLFTSNFTLTLSYVFGSVKGYYCHSKEVRALIELIQDVDISIQKITSLQQLKSVYQDYVKTGNHVGLLISSIGYSACVAYVASPIYELSSYSLRYYNGTVYEGKKFMISLWYPFDPYKHYLAANVIQLLACFYGPACLINSNVLISNLFIFTVGQFKILQTYLRNIQQYVNELKINENISQEVAELIVIRKCAVQYDQIMRFVMILNHHLSLFMFFDFMVCSVRIAFGVTQILGNMEINIVSFFGLVLYMSVLMAEVYAFYWFANEIILQSGDEMAKAIYDMNWYELSLPAKKHLLFMMVRTNRPPKLMIGPFYPMSLAAAQQMFKMCYCYLCLIKNS